MPKDPCLSSKAREIHASVKWETKVHSSLRGQLVSKTILTSMYMANHCFQHSIKQKFYTLESGFQSPIGNVLSFPITSISIWQSTNILTTLMFLSWHTSNTICMISTTACRLELQIVALKPSIMILISKNNLIPLTSVPFLKDPSYIKIILRNFKGCEGYSLIALSCLLE